MHIRSPFEWLLGSSEAAAELGSDSAATYWQRQAASPPVVRHIAMADLGVALRAGVRDFAAARTDVAFLCLIYPVIGLILAGVAAHHALLPMLFPLAAGFALVGPIAAIGLYEMSRRRDITGRIAWIDVFGVLRSPSIWAIGGLALILAGLFLLWLLVARLIYGITLGPLPPPSTRAFIAALFGTAAGWKMIGIGVAVGAVFAVVVLAVAVVSFPLLLDRPIGLGKAMAVSVRAVRVNPGPLAVWGLIVAGSLFLGSLPFFVGLVVVLPVLGHATWHLYRALVGGAPIPRRLENEALIAAR